ncbi:MAG: thioredoxin fold domain-containing protein [Deltaproteobacteria bacterium]|nr:thioredoxin fold domain-containing protein [Deltaproteobacteria bacterium]
MKGLNWRKNIEEAMKEIAGGTRFGLLFFYDPDCEGSIETLAKTFEDERVIHLIKRETAPVMINTRSSADIMKKYRVNWTPAFIITDETGVELERWAGYLPADDFMAQLKLSKGLAAFHLGRYAEAKGEFDLLVEDHPDSDLVPEAEYFRGAAAYKLEGDVTRLGEMCAVIREKHPDTIWAKKCSVWAHLTGVSNMPQAGFVGGGGSGVY